jgi:hypothetical protein
MRTITLSVLAGAALLIPAAAAPAATSCGTLNGGFENTITASGVNCSTAKTLIRKWHKRAVDQGQGPGTKYVGSWYCVSHPTDPEHVKVNCAMGKDKVRFFAGP